MTLSVTVTTGHTSDGKITVSGPVESTSGSVAEVKSNSPSEEFPSEDAASLPSTHESHMHDGAEEHSHAEGHGDVMSLLHYHSYYQMEDDLTALHEKHAHVATLHM